MQRAAPFPGGEPQHQDTGEPHCARTLPNGESRVRRDRRCTGYVDPLGEIGKQTWPVRTSSGAWKSARHQAPGPSRTVRPVGVKREEREDD